MSALLDLDDVVAGNPVAEKELAALRDENRRLWAFIEDIRYRLDYPKRDGREAIIIGGSGNGVTCTPVSEYFLKKHDLFASTPPPKPEPPPLRVVREDGTVVNQKEIDDWDLSHNGEGQ